MGTGQQNILLDSESKAFGYRSMKNAIARQMDCRGNFNLKYTKHVLLDVGKKGG
jgi:hypothetical protein